MGHSGMGVLATQHYRIRTMTARFAGYTTMDKSMTYDIHNAVFTTMMYESKVPLKDGEQHCPYCSGYCIRAIPRARGERNQRHADCQHCDRTGKWAK